MKKIKLGQKEIIHFVGIGGIGMSGLAQVMKNRLNDVYKNFEKNYKLRLGQS